MKTLITSIVLAVILSSCEAPGTTAQKLNGDESNLPPELKGLKVYSVSIGDGVYVKVAVLNDQINSSTYNVGKRTETVLYIKEKDKLINVKDIIMENDSLITCRK